MHKTTDSSPYFTVPRLVVTAVLAILFASPATGETGPDRQPTRFWGQPMDANPTSGDTEANGAQAIRPLQSLAGGRPEPARWSIRPYANRIEIVDNSANILGLRWEFKM